MTEHPHGSPTDQFILSHPSHDLVDIRPESSRHPTPARPHQDVLDRAARFEYGARGKHSDTPDPSSEPPKDSEINEDPPDAEDFRSMLIRVANEAPRTPQSRPSLASLLLEPLSPPPSARAPAQQAPSADPAAPRTSPPRAEIASAGGGSRAVHTHTHGHDHSHAIMVDLDEAVHAIYALVQNIIQSAHHGASQIVKSVADQASQLGHHPLRALAETTSPSGVADFAVTAGAAGFVSALSIIALKAGVHEALDAIHEGKEIDIEIGLLSSCLDRLRESMTSRPEPAEQELLHRVTTELEEALATRRFHKTMNRHSLGIGASSAFSGGMILTKAALEMGTKGGLAASAHTLNLVTPAAAGATAATAVGLASTFALGPLAGIGAFALSGFFLNKSRLKSKHFKKSEALVRQMLSSRRDLGTVDPESSSSPGLDAYLHFLDTKLKQRANFHTSFMLGNAAFCAGSSVYAGSTVAKAGLACAALTGAGALASNPVGAGILLAAGTAGALTMGLGSLQYLYKHGQQQRYDRQLVADDPLSDRSWLQAVDILHPDGPRAGVALRARLYHLLEQREIKRQNLLAKFARTQNLTYQPIRYSTDEGPRGNKLSEAWKKSRATHKSAHLADGLARWLETPENHRTTVLFMRESIADQIHYLSHKLLNRYAFGEHLLDDIARHEAQRPLEPQSREAPVEDSGLAEILGKLATAQRQDEQILDALASLDGSLSEVGSPSGAPFDLPKLQLDFVALQRGISPRDVYEPQELAQSHHDLAKFLTTEAPKQHKDRRGMLLEAEMQAARITSRLLSTTQPSTPPATPPAPEPRSSSCFRLSKRASRSPEGTQPSPAVASPPPQDPGPSRSGAAGPSSPLREARHAHSGLSPAARRPGVTEDDR